MTKLTSLPHGGSSLIAATNTTNIIGMWSIGKCEVHEWKGVLPQSLVRESVPCGDFCRVTSRLSVKRKKKKKEQWLSPPTKGPQKRTSSAASVPILKANIRKWSLTKLKSAYNQHERKALPPVPPLKRFHKLNSFPLTNFPNLHIFTLQGRLVTHSEPQSLLLGSLCGTPSNTPAPYRASNLPAEQSEVIHHSHLSRDHDAPTIQVQKLRH